MDRDTFTTTIEAFQNRRPIRPFTVALTDGDRYEVDRPNILAVGEGIDVWKVGIFVDETPAAIEDVMRAANLDVAQIYGGGAPAGARVWKAFRVADSFNGALGDGAEAVFLDSAKNGVSFDWKLARNAGPKVVVAGGLDASNVAAAIEAAKPWGVDASSKLESAPGIKDHDKVRAFVKAAREATW